MVQTLILIVLLIMTWSNPQRQLCDSLPLCGLVKYIAALSVIWVHLMIAHCDALFWVMESNFGSKAVSVFLFFSGYGLMHGYIRKGKSYLDGFVRKRMGKIIVPLFVAYICYLLVQCLFGYSLDGLQIMKSLLTDSPYLPYSWYVSEIVLIYLAFYCVARTVRPSGVAMVLSVIIVLLMACGIAAGIPNWWTCSTLCFLVGLWVRKYENEFYAWIQKIRLWFLPLMILLFFCTFNWVRIKNATGLAGMESFSELYPYIANLCFVVVLVYALMKIKSTPHQLPIYSSFYELYLMQGTIFLITGAWLQTSVLLIAVNFILCIILSYIVYKFNQWLIQKIHL